MLQCLLEGAAQKAVMAAWLSPFTKHWGESFGAFSACEAG